MKEETKKSVNIKTLREIVDNWKIQRWKACEEMYFRTLLTNPS